MHYAAEICGSPADEVRQGCAEVICANCRFVSSIASATPFRAGVFRDPVPAAVLGCKQCKALARQGQCVRSARSETQGSSTT